MELRLIDGEILTGNRLRVEIEEDGTVTHVMEVTNKPNLKDQEVKVNEKEIFLLLNAD